MAGPVAGFAPHPGREPTGCVSREQQAEAIIRRIVNKHGMPLRRPKTFSWQLYGAPSSTPYVRDHLEGVSTAVMEREYRPAHHQRNGRSNTRRLQVNTLGNVTAGSKLTSARALLGSRQARFAQRLVVRLSDPEGVRRS